MALGSMHVEIVQRQVLYRLRAIVVAPTHRVEAMRRVVQDFDVVRLDVEYPVAPAYRLAVALPDDQPCGIRIKHLESVGDPFDAAAIQNDVLGANQPQDAPSDHHLAVHVGDSDRLLLGPHEVIEAEVARISTGVHADNISRVDRLAVKQPISIDNPCSRMDMVVTRRRLSSWR